MLALNETSERLAMAFAFGVFLTLTPFIGLHTVLALGLAFAFGLNRAAILLGMFVNNPWTLIPYYTMSTYLGGRVVGFPHGMVLPEFAISELGHANFWIQIAHQWRLLIPMAVGSTILAVLIGVISYPVALYAIRRGRTSLSARA
jgi:uncharacterized protein (DUF2062 family)